MNFGRYIKEFFGPLRGAPEVDRRIRHLRELVTWRTLTCELSSDSPIVTAETMVTEMAEWAVKARPDHRDAHGRLPQAVIVRRFFVTANRAFSFSARFEFRELENGKFACGLSNTELAKFADLGRQLKMFLN